MKHINSPFTAVTLSLALITADSCVDQKLSSQNNPASNNPATVTGQNTAFNKNVGKPIDSFTALRWMNNFKLTSSRTTVSTYIIEGGALTEILATKNCVGISLHYATDSQGALHILPIGVDNNGKAMAAKTVSTQNGKIDWQTAWQWIDQYSGPIRAHFFGSSAYAILLTEQHSKQVRASIALNDVAAPQLLLSDASQSAPTTYLDASFACPPICLRK